MTAVVHPTAIIEHDVVLGDNTRVWDNVHIRHSTSIGADCIVGEKSHISYGVRIADRVKINAFVYICTGITVETGVMISAGVVFTNDRYPRATTSDLSALQSSDPNQETGTTLVQAGATIGARAVIATNLEIGRFSMIGMGSVVTRDVPSFHLVFGNPARSVGHVCRCGHPIARFQVGEVLSYEHRSCDRCDLSYSSLMGRVTEVVSALK